MFRKAYALTALKSIKKKKKIYIYDQGPYGVDFCHQRMRNIKRLWSCFFAFHLQAQTSSLSHCGGSRLRCAAPGPGSPRGTPSCGPSPGQSSTWGRWSTWSGSTCSQTHWLHSHKEMNGGSCGILRLQEKRTTTIKIEIANQKKSNTPGKPGILRTAVHVITSYPFHKTLMTHQQQAHWAIDSGHWFCLFTDKTCCIPIIYRPQGPHLFTDQTACVHGSHTGPIIQRSQARYNVLPAAHTLGMTSLTQPSANGIDLTWIAIGLRAPIWSDDFSQWCSIFLEEKWFLTISRS